MGWGLLVASGGFLSHGPRHFWRRLRFLARVSREIPSSSMRWTSSFEEHSSIGCQLLNFKKLENFALNRRMRFETYCSATHTNLVRVSSAKPLEMVEVEDGDRLRIHKSIYMICSPGWRSSHSALTGTIRRRGLPIISQRIWSKLPMAKASLSY